ncbi:MAG: dicarboxylate/amino acid:cation symporter [Gammaproteobacteria bacterium]|nr:dicarboxylate/amino acid:cation symporter [Gammaproteobacteria bacterium]
MSVGPSRLNWLLSPWAIILAVGLGLYLGLQQPQMAMELRPIGDIYLGLLKMCILPILLSAITLSLGRMMQSPGAGELIRRMLLVFGVGLLLTSLLATGLALISAPGKDLGDDTLASLGGFASESKYLPDLEIALNQPPVAADNPGLMGFITRMVPENVFNALSEGINLQVLVFAILFGLALGHLDRELSGPFFQVLEAAYRAFNNLIRWMMYPLPLALMVLLANQVAQVGLDILLAMLLFVEVSLLAMGLLFMVSLLIIWRRSGTGFWASLGALRETMLVSLATRSTLAAIPSAMQGMQQGLGFDKAKIDLVVPLGITAARHGNVLYSAIVAVFVAQLYQLDLGGQALLLLVFGAVLAGIATAGAPGLVGLSMLSIVLEPLGLPLEVILVLLIAIEPLIDPFRTLVSVQASCASAALIAPAVRRGQAQQAESTVASEGAGP